VRSERGRPRSDGSHTERWAIAQFAVSGLVAVAVVFVLVLIAFGRTERDEAVDHAEELTRIAARGVVAPALTRAALGGGDVRDADSRATRTLDRVIRTSLLREPVLRVVVWDSVGHDPLLDEARPRRLARATRCRGAAG
jgi:hypothetical protein